MHQHEALAPQEYSPRGTTLRLKVLERSHRVPHLPANGQIWLRGVHRVRGTNFKNFFTMTLLQVFLLRPLFH